jgi:tetratricopeptide (TPR) repeat protein
MLIKKEEERMKIDNVHKAIVVVLLLFSTANFVLAQSGRGKGRLKGEVLDENGNPIENAKIVITSMEYQDLSFEATSNKKGNWAVIGLGSGMWRVTIAAEGYSPAYTDIDVKQLKKNPKIVMALEKIKQTAHITPQDRTSLDLINQGNEFFAEKKYDEAISVFEKFLEKNPGSSQIHINIGNCYIQKNELDKAAQEFNKVLEGIKPEKDDISANEIATKAMAGMGEVYLLKGDFEKAQKYIEKVLDNYPEDERMTFNMGEIYFSNNKIGEAIHYYELSKQINPKWGKPYLKLGYAYLNKGNFEKAKENFRMFIKVDPDSPDVQTAQNILEYLEK